MYTCIRIIMCYVFLSRVMRKEDACVLLPSCVPSTFDDQSRVIRDATSGAWRAERLANFYPECASHAYSRCRADSST